MNEFPYLHIPTGITVAQLKEAIKSWPDTHNGEETQVWLVDNDGFSNLAKVVGRMDSSDIFLEW